MFVKEIETGDVYEVFGTRDYLVRIEMENGVYKKPSAEFFIYYKDDWKWISAEDFEPN